MPGRIVINARAAVRVEVTGVERWAKEMVARLPGLRPDDYVVAAPPRALAHKAGHAWEQIVLPARAARVRAAVIYSPANLAPALSRRNAVLIHDAGAFRSPEWYSRAFIAWQRAIVPRVAREARLILTVSEFSRNELVDLLDADPEAVAVVPGGVDERFHPGAESAAVRGRLGLSAPYVLTVGSLTPRKNLTALDVAARCLREQGYELVVAGAGRGHVRASAPGLAAARVLGRVPDADLPGLYAGAAAFVYPSRYEGFGLPCIEAMACGVPVVAARAGALPETCGDAALLASPDDPEEIADAIERLLADSALAERLRESGLARARLFSWDRAARETDAHLARLQDGQPPRPAV